MPTLYRLLKSLEKAGFARKDLLTKKHYVGTVVDSLALLQNQLKTLIAAHESSTTIYGLLDCIKRNQRRR